MPGRMQARELQSPGSGHRARALQRGEEWGEESVLPRRLCSPCGEEIYSPQELGAYREKAWCCTSKGCCLQHPRLPTGCQHHRSEEHTAGASPACGGPKATPAAPVSAGPRLDPDCPGLWFPTPTLPRSGAARGQQLRGPGTTPAPPSEACTARSCRGGRHGSFLRTVLLGTQARPPCCRSTCRPPPDPIGPGLCQQNRRLRAERREAASGQVQEQGRVWGRGRAWLTGPTSATSPPQTYCQRRRLCSTRLPHT
ncbi:unnamed protein product [Rangifer tarandus platyrhynchus]|uniref:Uncharacterized protein n=1 Tax=Rangifer tarandus platyrhynchus TaxID=3082113 RepID=A0ABN8Y9U8_RANTA|nr:unnamed protein product [Rangifer tarandus platyrhynchus]